MCGIAGFVSHPKRNDYEFLKSMTNALEKRGSDDEGHLIRNIQEVSVALGHRRLSVLDLSAGGHQPMSYDGLSIVYNGEVYNYKEIRSELTGAGYSFCSESDTEVVLKAYHKWGLSAIHKFNGMFAIAILDHRINRLKLIRDRSGVKPLYYYKENNVFLFSSELKSFHSHPSFQKKINIDGLGLFLQYGYIPQPYTIFDNAFKLKAGHYLEVDLPSLAVREKKYWDISDFYPKETRKVSREEAVSTTEKLLISSCKYRAISDVPVGVFLSGGYDSSTVAALLQNESINKIKTFSIGFYEHEFNEAQYAKQVSDHLGTDHTEYYCTQNDALEILPTLPDIYDEPFGDISAIPTVLVSKLARKSVTVSLSADGGDEVFGGYDKYLRFKRQHEMFSRVPSFLQNYSRNALQSPIAHKLVQFYGFELGQERLNRYAEMVGANLTDIQSIGQSTFLRFEVEQILKPKLRKLVTEFDATINSQNWLASLQQLDYKTYLVDDILTKVDRATMSVTLEGREPLLDHRLVEYVASLDSGLKINGGSKKWLLKQIAHGYLPKKLMERPKMGFGIPLDRWLKGELNEMVRYYLNTNRIKSGGIFNEAIVENLCDRYFRGEAVNSRKLWYLLVFEMWRERWM